MLALLKMARRIIEGSISAIILIGVVAALGWSDAINMLVAERSASAILFLFAMAVLLADLIAKMITIFGNTFPDLIPKVEDDDRERASLIERLQPGQTVALLSGAYAARVVFFIVVFGLLGASYAAAPDAVQDELVGDYSALAAGEAFLREGLAGSIGYFLFFLGGENLAPIKNAIAPTPLESNSLDGDIFLSGIRLYGLAFALAILRTLATPITFARARMRARKIRLDEEERARA